MLNKEDEKQRQSGCTTKTRYRTKRKALRKKGGTPYGKGMSAYHCKFCGWWHLGHDKTAMRKSLAR